MEQSENKRSLVLPISITSFGPSVEAAALQAALCAALRAVVIVHSETGIKRLMYDSVQVDGVRGEDSRSSFCVKIRPLMCEYYWNTWFVHIVTKCTK